MRDGWRQVTLGDVADTLLGKTLPRGGANVEGALPYLRNVNVQWGRIDTGGLNRMLFSSSERELYSLRPGDILVCEGGEVGRLAVVKSDLDGVYFQNAIHRVRVHDGTDPRFVALSLEGLVRSGGLIGLVRRVTIAHLNQTTLRKLPLALPPLSEQRRIVDLIAAVDDAIEAAEAEARATHMALVAALSNSFNFGGSDARAVSEMIGYSLGGAWGATPGAEAQEVCALGPSAYKGGAVAVDVSLATLRSLSSKRAMARSLEQGDIVLERSGGSPAQPVGRVIRMEGNERFVVPSDFMRLVRVDRSVAEPSYVFWALWCAYEIGLSVRFQKRTTNIFNLNIVAYLAAVRVTTPPKAEQARVAGLAESGLVSLKSARATADALRTLRSNLLTVLLSGEHEIPESYDQLLNLEGEVA